MTKDPGKVTISTTEYEELKEKAAGYDLIEAIVDSAYEDDSDADLGDIGESVAIHFGYL